MVIERLMQEHGINRAAIRVGPAGADSIVGTELGGADTERGAGTTVVNNAAPIAGKIFVEVDAGDSVAATVQKALAEFAAKPCR